MGSQPLIGIVQRTRKSPFHDATVKAGVKGFTVYNHMLMPIWYDTPTKDYWHLVTNVTMWDVAVERQVEIAGPDAKKFVQYLTPRNLTKMKRGQCKYVPMVDENGGMINDPVLLKLAEDHYWLSIADSDVLLWAKGLAHAGGYDVEVIEPDVSPLAVQGPNAEAVVAKLLGDWIKDIKFFWFKECKLDGIPLVVARSGWSKQGGFELYLRDGKYGTELWNRVAEAGAEYGIKPATPSTIERVESGLLSYGNDMDLSVNPYEIGLDKYVSQKVDYIGKEALQKIKAEGIKRTLVSMVVEGSELAGAANHWPISTAAGDPAGTMTTVTYSPRLMKTIALALVPIEHSDIGTRLRVETSDGMRNCVVSKTPFIEPGELTYVVMPKVVAEEKAEPVKVVESLPEKPDVRKLVATSREKLYNGQVSTAADQALTNSEQPIINNQVSASSADTQSSNGHSLMSAPQSPTPNPQPLSGLMMDYQLTTQPIMERARRLYAKKEIVTRDEWGTHRYTYADFYKRCNRLANGLASLGIKRGDRVGTFGTNSYRHLELYFGVPSMGAVCHTLNVRLHTSQLEYIINHADDRVIVADSSLIPLLEPIADKLPNVTHYVIMHQPNKPIPATSLPNAVSYETLLATQSDSYEWPKDLKETEAAAMCYTSGTTGNPKGALYTHRSIYLHALSECTNSNFGISESDVVMPTVPMFHVLSWGMPYASTLMGAKQVYPTSFMAPDQLVDLIESEKVTFTAGVPSLWLGILNYLEGNGGDISSLRRVPVGGSAAPRALIDTFREQYGVEIAHAWGMTEMSPLGSVAYLKAYQADWSDDDKAAVRAKQGLPLPHVEWRVADDEGNDLPWDGESVGELQVKGPCVISEYYNDDRSAGSFIDGWFKTGDVVTIDEEGNMAIVDRTKDLIKSGGEWISSVDLENSLMAHPDVLEACVVGLPHEQWGERPIAVIVPNPNSSAPPTKESLDELLLKTFEKWQLPNEYVMSDEVLKTSTGKFNKKGIRAQFENHVLK